MPLYNFSSDVPELVIGSGIRVCRFDGCETIPFDEAIISAGSLKRLVWTTYWVDGQFTTSGLAIRLLEFQSGIRRGHSAVVAFSTPITTSTQDARQRLASLIASFGNLSAGLGRVGSAPALNR